MGQNSCSWSLVGSGVNGQRVINIQRRKETEGQVQNVKRRGCGRGQSLREAGLARVSGSLLYGIIQEVPCSIQFMWGIQRLLFSFVRRLVLALAQNST